MLILGGNAGRFKIQLLGIWPATGRDEQVRSLQALAHTFGLHSQEYALLEGCG